MGSVSRGPERCVHGTSSRSVDGMRARDIGDSTCGWSGQILARHGLRAAFMHRENDNPGTHVRPRIEIDNVLVQHADASARNLLADRGWSVRSMNAVDRAADVHRARAQRISRTARHETRQIWLALKHLRRRDPVWPLGLALNGFHARPGKTLAADTDPVTDGLASSEHEIEIRIRRIDNDGAGGFTRRIADDLTVQACRNFGRGLHLINRLLNPRGLSEQKSRVASQRRIAERLGTSS